MSISTSIMPITKVASKVLGRTGLFIRNYSPQILTTVGVAGVVTSAVLASKATLQLESVIDNTRFGLDAAEKRTHELTADEYSSTDHKREVVKVYVHTAGDMFKLYGPAVTLGVASIACIIGSHGIMHKRNVAVVAAYKGLEQTFVEYRKRVVDEFGEDKDKEYRYGIHKETILDEKGKEQEVDVVTPSAKDPNVRIFDGSNKNFSPHPDYNLMFLRAQETMANDILQAQGHFFLNEALDMCGFERTKAGAVTGWVWKGDGDNFIDFGIQDLQTMKSRTFGVDDQDNILLDFNVDGIILDALRDK